MLASETLGVGFGIGVLIGNLSALEYFPVKSPAVCLRPDLFLNVHKIRVDSDNKR